MQEKPPLTASQRRILAFFQEQPQAVETARGIATWLNSPSQEVEKALDELVDRKWLLAHRAPMVVGYALTQDEHRLVEIQEALKTS